MRSSKALAALLALTMAVPLQVALVAAPAGAAPVPLAVTINGTQFAGTQYLIVTPAAYAPVMQSIADWKTQKGVPARVANLEDIEASYPGRDGAEKIHEFLQDVYFNGTPRTLKYVVLGGGSALVPTRYLYTHGGSVTTYTNNFTLSDVYYAGLSNDWDSNGDGNYGEYGEEDWDAEVYVGRLPFNSLADAGYMRDNILSYEKAPFVGSWMQSAAAFASVMDPPNDAATYFSWEDNAIRPVWDTQAYIPSTMTLDLLADYYELAGGNYSTGQDRLSSASEIGSINAGKSVVMSITHGWVPTGRGQPSYNGTNGSRGTPQYIGFNGIVASWGDGLTYANVSEFTNFGQLPFGYFSSCIVGNFADPTLPSLARFVVQNNHGFIGVVVPTDGTLRGENEYVSASISYGNWWQSTNYWKHFFTGTDPFRPGPALYEGIRDYSAHVVAVGKDPSDGDFRNQKAVYNLLGDPEIPIWTAVAQNLNLTLPAQVYTAESHFRATVRDTLGRPMAGATVALKGPGVYAVGTADALGRVDIVITPTATGTLRVTATLHNFIPLEASVPIQTAPADLAISPANVFLPSPVLRTGYPVVVNFTVRNVGQMAAGAADARATAAPPSGLPQIVAPSLPLGALAAGAHADASFNWTPTDDGLWTLDVIADPTNAVTEFDELNNDATVPVYASSVDLAFADGSIRMNPPGQVAPGGLIVVTGSMANTGLVPRSFLVGYELLRGDGSVVGAGNTVVSTTEADFTLEVAAPEAGVFTLRLIADAAAEVLEFNEDNNEADFPVRAGAGPTIFTLPPVLVDEDAPPTNVVADLRGFVADPDTPFSELVFAASSSDGRLAVWVDGVALVAHPQLHWAGTGTVTLTVSDGRESATSTTAFTVRAAESPPVVEAPGPQSARAGEPFVFQIAASDPDGGGLTYTSSASGPSVMPSLPIDANGKIAFVPPPEMAGSWTFTVFVRDATNRQTAVQFQIFVMPENHPPTLVDLGVVEVRRGAGVSFRLAAIDPDGDPVTFSSDSTRARVSEDGTVQMDALQVDALPEGESVIPIAVSDGVGQGTGFVRVHVVEAVGSTAQYGGDLGVMVSALAAVVAAGAAVVWVVRKGKGEKR